MLGQIFVPGFVRLTQTAQPLLDLCHSSSVLQTDRQAAWQQNGNIRLQIHVS